MGSGTFRDTIIIKRNKGEQGTKGQLLNTFNIIRTTKADVKILSGAELIKSGVSLNTEYASILIRRESRLKHKDVIEWEGNDYTVNSIRPYKRNRQMIVSVSRDI